MLITKDMKLNIEIYMYELFENVGIDTSDNLYKLIDELEIIIQNAIYDYAEDYNIDL